MRLSDKIAQHRHVWCFGCSFTRYEWHTWADFLKQKFKNVTNLGHPGAGNFYIFSKIMENLSNGHIQPDDMIMVCWTGHYRLDMKYRGEWKTRGNLLTQDYYETDFVEKYCDPHYFLERDLYLVYAINEIFKDRIINLSMGDIDRIDQYNDIFIPLHKVKNIQQTLETFHPSFYKVLWNNKFKTIAHRNDYHPTEEEHKSYLKKVFEVEI